MDSPDSVAGPSTSAGPSPLSPLKRQGSAPPPDNAGVAQASKRLRSVLLDGADEAELGKGKGKQEDTGGAKDSLLADLEAQVTCGICQEVFHRPLALLPCLHTYCGSCLVPWLRRSSACPSCRAQATSTSPAHSSGRLVDLYLGLPGASEGRSAEKGALDEIYKAGQAIVFGAGDEDDEEEEGYTDEEEEDGGEEEDEYGVVRPPTYHHPCRYCPQGSGEPYTCPRPIPNPATTVPELCILDNHPPPGHIRCHNCEKLSPADEAQWAYASQDCEMCKVFACGLGEWECDGGLVNSIWGHQIPNGTVTDILPRSFAGLRSEQAILNDYLVAKGWSLAELAQQKLFVDHRASLERPKWLGPALDGDNQLVVNSVTCRRCFFSCFETLVVKWWTEERETEAAKSLLDPAIVSRQDCWYGIDCRTAPHNLAHSTRLNHLCPPTRLPHPLPPAPPSGHRARGFDPSYPAPAFSHNQLTFRDLDGAPVLLSSHVLPDGSKIPGKTILIEEHGVLVPSSLIGRDGHEVGIAGPAEVLFETDEMKWVRARDGVVPEGNRPVVGGVDADGAELYHAAARTWKEGIRVPGASNEAIGGASIPWDHREWIYEEYDLLCWK